MQQSSAEPLPPLQEIDMNNQTQKQQVSHFAPIYFVIKTTSELWIIIASLH